MRPFVESRCHRFRIEECPFCRDNPDATLESHHRHVIHEYQAKAGMPLTTEWAVKSDRDALAFVHQDRWIAECPMPGCQSCEYVTPCFPFFVCTSSCGQGPFKVVFPKNKEAIEAELLKRPVRATRNWLLGETVAGLKRENKQHEKDLVA